MSVVDLPIMPAREPATERKAFMIIAKNFLIGVFNALGAWHDRAAERRRLLTFDDRMLTDIGVDRATAIDEGSKPFWRQ